MLFCLGRLGSIHRNINRTAHIAIIQIEEEMDVECFNMKEELEKELEYYRLEDEWKKYINPLMFNDLPLIPGEMNCILGFRTCIANLSKVVFFAITYEVGNTDQLGYIVEQFLKKIRALPGFAEDGHGISHIYIVEPRESKYHIHEPYTENDELYNFGFKYLRLQNGFESYEQFPIPAVRMQYLLSLVPEDWNV